MHRQSQFQSPLTPSAEHGFTLIELMVAMLASS
jgi:prepilin-type N-terminal cleavage/methylation domain-containing protein